MSRPIFEADTIKIMIDRLIGSCYPYGDTSIDEDRFESLKVKIELAENLIDEIIDAGKLYDRPEYSIQNISNKANQWLTDTRDWLNEIEYLPKSTNDME